jgi:hypothetical protein
MVVIAVLCVAGPVLAAPVSITVPELRFDAGAEAGADDPSAAAVPTSRAATISVPALVYTSGETKSEDSVASERGDRVGAQVVIRTPGLRFGGDATAAEASEDGVATVRTARLHYRPAGVEGDTDGAAMSYVAFRTGALSGTRLSVDAATVSTQDALEVTYRGLPAEGRHRLILWLLAKSEPRLYGETRTVEGETSGSWRPELAVAGPYRICVALSGGDADPRRAPANADECLDVAAVWGDPANPPRPLIDISPAQPVAGRDFELAYRDMPTGANAKIFIHEVGAPRLANAAASVATRGNASGQRSLRIYEPGDYEIRVVYERTGRQTRATSTLRVVPRTEETQP